MKKVLFMCVVFAICVGTASAEQAQPTVARPAAKPAPKPAAEKIVSDNPNNQELIDLAQGGAKESILLGAVADAKRENRTYDKSAKEILKLTKAGVTDAVIEAVRANSGTSAASTVPAQSAPPTVVVQTPTSVGVHLDQPSTIAVDGREAGIYVARGKDLDRLEPSVYSGAKSGNKIWAAMPVVGKATMKGVVRSAASTKRLQTTTPTFYFLFENKGSGLSNTGFFSGLTNGASSPEEFILVRLKVSKGERELTLGEETHYNSRLGPKPEDIVDMAITKLRDGAYEVRPSAPLTPGEYCFFFQGGPAVAQGGTGKIFTFGVDPGASAQQ